MTDKQIIIDVTQCPYYKEDRTCTYLPYKSKCEGDCNWTSYKEMEEQLEAYKMEAEEGKEINAELKAENKRFKETLDGLFKVQYKLADNNKKLRQCLTEIKEIAEHCIKQDICTTCDNSDKCHIEDEEIPTYDVCKLILQIINECEGNNEYS